MDGIGSILLFVFYLGQFSMPVDKRLLYEFDIRVPLLMRGPGVPKNVTKSEVVLNIDLTPTILDIANSSMGYPQSMDGMSFFPLIQVKYTQNKSIVLWVTNNLITKF